MKFSVTLEFAEDHPVAKMLAENPKQKRVLVTGALVAFEQIRRIEANERKKPLVVTRRDSPQIRSLLNSQLGTARRGLDSARSALESSVRNNLDHLTNLMEDIQKLTAMLDLANDTDDSNHAANESGDSVLS